MCVHFCMSMARIGCFLDRAPTYDKVHRWVSGLPCLDDDLYISFYPSTRLGNRLEHAGPFREDVVQRVQDVLIPIALAA